MQPENIALLVTGGRPVVLADGRVIVARSHPDLAMDRNASHLVIVEKDGTEHDFTVGPRDGAPVLSPDGSTVVFSRAGESGPPQLYAIRVDGGEARPLTDHPLGASQAVFSPCGSQLAYLAAVPDEGRYGTDEEISADVEAPRRIPSLAYRRDGKGFVLDRPEQIFLTDVWGTPARQLTHEVRGVGRPAFLPDASALIYTRSTGANDITTELVVHTVPDLSDTDEIVESRVLATGVGTISGPIAIAAHDAGSGLGEAVTVLFQAEQFAGVDFAGRTKGLFAVSAAGGAVRRLTDERTVQLADGELVLQGGHVLAAVENRGAVEVRAIPLDAESARLDSLPTVLGGQRVVRAFDVNSGVLAAVVGLPNSFSELLTATIDGIGCSEEKVLTKWGADLAATGISEPTELNGTSADGYPVHGWLFVPDGPGPHPVLLNIHGGPHAQYTWSLFDEAQVAVSAGYAVVMGNPRGSSGYGQDHGRAIVRALGTVDADDLVALLDTALENPALDAARVGVMGGSYGGFMTGWLLSQYPDRFVAGISERAVNAWDSFAGSSDIGYFFAEAYVGTDRDEQWARSPLAHAAHITAPVLIVHSEHDWRCPIEQAQRLFVALQQQGTDSEMLLFPAEGHELSRSGRPRHRQQRFDAMLQWWGRHLPVQAL